MEISLKIKYKYGQYGINIDKAFVEKDKLILKIQIKHFVLSVLEVILRLLLP